MPLPLTHVNLLTLVDFEQPRALWEKVFSDTDKEHFVYNVSVHLGGVKSPIIKARQRKSPRNNPIVDSNT